MLTIQKAIKKPVEIDFVSFNGTYEQALKIETWINESNSACKAFADGEYEPSLTPTKLIIRTLEGDMAAIPGDKIIKGVNGEFYPCKADVFEKNLSGL